MDSKSRNVLSAAVVTAALLGTLMYTAYRSRNSAKEAPKKDSGAPSTKVRSTKNGNSQQRQQQQQQAKPIMTLPPESTIPPDERAKALELLAALKQQANTAFQECRYEDAIKRYEDCLEVTAVLGARDAEALQIDLVVRANVIMTFIRLRDYNSARHVATMLLEDAAAFMKDDLRVKVLYRRGLASKFLADRGAALADFKAALHLSQGQLAVAITKEIELLEKER
ncbi:hypothetical protein ABL78_6354 [Leptomonas seymouri]|uniref:Uncharacterized protein n=1 Tax=Leptomonas seymouri TaxID=5684 RepID=A0A0N1PAP4_LEPSE|nr:hypothetical protein ABL78_6354 [Leptomonas seymouri]|eukprot:KPI84593.1 hypothetical protein ABL78_6354 [Leptomonas seymouri]